MPTRQHTWSPHRPLQVSPRRVTALPLAWGGWAAGPPARDPEPVRPSPSISAKTSPPRSRRVNADSGAGGAPIVSLASWTVPVSAFSAASDGKFRTDAFLGTGGRAPPSTSNKHAMSTRSTSDVRPLPAGRQAMGSTRQAELPPTSPPHQTRHTRCRTLWPSRTKGSAPDGLNSAVHNVDKVAKQPPSAASCLPHGGWLHPRRHSSTHQRPRVHPSVAPSERRVLALAAVRRIPRGANAPGAHVRRSSTSCPPPPLPHCPYPGARTWAHAAARRKRCPDEQSWALPPVGATVRVRFAPAWHVRPKLTFCRSATPAEKSPRGLCGAGEPRETPAHKSGPARVWGATRQAMAGRQRGRAASAGWPWPIG